VASALVASTLTQIVPGLTWDLSQGSIPLQLALIVPGLTWDL
jgi:hypothetical protein